MNQELIIPPGLVASGTERQSAGYWRDGNLTAWRPTLQPIGGWRDKSLSAVTGKARAVQVWRDGNGVRWVVIGTHSGLYVMDSVGTIYNITPAAFTAGAADATNSAGYGAGLYGEGTYGTPIIDTSVITPCGSWTADNFGQYFVGTAESDGRLFQWSLITGTVAAVISGAPTARNALVTTAESTIFALGDRNVAWCNRGDQTDWTPLSTNEAGDYDLETLGTLQCGCRVRGATLVFSDADVFAATYRRDVFVYDFQRVGADGTGVVSKGAAQSLEDGAVWWSHGNFMRYNGGAVEAIPCAVWDAVFADVNETQISKVTSFHNARYGEMWWFYPTAASTENNKAVAWNYRSGTWTLHDIARLSGSSASGVYDYPMVMDADGMVLEHEVGSNWDSAVPMVRSGPIELGAGDDVWTLESLIGDERVIGECQIRVFTRDYPGLTETDHGAFALTDRPVWPRVTARQHEFQIEFLSDSQSRIGAIRYGAIKRGRR